MEIIYKSPSIFLDGLFFKTPPLSISQISIFTKERIPYTSTITCVLDRVVDADFIKMLKSIDSYLSHYIIRQAKDINIKMKEDENHFLNIESILKPYININLNQSKKHFKKSINTTTKEQSIPLTMSIESQADIKNPISTQIAREKITYSTVASSNVYNKNWKGDVMIQLKSYLDRTVLDDLKHKIQNANKNHTNTNFNDINYKNNNEDKNAREDIDNAVEDIDNARDEDEKKYVLTFNISNIYFSRTSLTPLIKCNKCEEVNVKK